MNIHIPHFWIIQLQVVQMFPRFSETYPALLLLLYRLKMLRCGREVKGCIWHHLQSPQMPKSLPLPSNSGGEWSPQPLGALHKEKHRAPGYMTLKTKPVRFSRHTCFLPHSVVLITLEILTMLTEFTNKKTRLLSRCQWYEIMWSSLYISPFKKDLVLKPLLKRAWRACDDAVTTAGLTVSTELFRQADVAAHVYKDLIQI